jgi:1-acyl-sn-glycerol-3-phosphate acyltransferase
MGRLRGASILTGFMGLTLPLMPVQALLLKTSRRAARHFPHWYHRRVCKLVGLRLHIDGAIVSGQPVLVVANHTSWLDIPVLSAVAPLSFVAKSEVGTWPFVSALARLQRTVFVDRKKKTSVGATANEIMARLAEGDTVVLFAEGTSSDGNRVLPFKTSLFGAVKPATSAGTDPASTTVVQTLSIVYTHLHGVPLGRADRPVIGWYGDMEMGTHAWELLKSGPIDVHIAIGPPIPLDAFTDRKQLARHSEAEVRSRAVAILRQGTVTAPPPSQTPAPATAPPSAIPSDDVVAPRRTPL